MWPSLTQKEKDQNAQISDAARLLLVLFENPSTCWCQGAADRTAGPLDLCVCARKAIVREELQRLISPQRTEGQCTVLPSE